jgi:sulfatase maturation enzyme AslB (radical SAM superfamily)
LNTLKVLIIDIYWYGGEPTTMGVKMFSDMCDIINSTFKTHKVRHILLSALVGVNLKEWAPIVKKYCNSKIQTSYDGLMRGERYDTTWKKQVVNALDRGLEVNTLSVFNKSIQFIFSNDCFNIFPNFCINSMLLNSS